MMLAVLVSLLPLVTPAPQGGFFDLPYSFLYGQNSPLGGSLTQELDTDIVAGRFLLKHHVFDGLDDVLETLGVDEENIKSIRNATIVTQVSITEEGEFSISTAAVDSEEEANVVTFTPDVETDITNPINGEPVKFVATPLGPTMIQTKSRGLETNTTEIKTWQFTPFGAAVSTEILRNNKLLPAMANQVMVRVDAENKEKPLVLRWV